MRNRVRPRSGEIPDLSIGTIGCWTDMKVPDAARIGVSSSKLANYLDDLSSVGSTYSKARIEPKQANKVSLGFSRVVRPLFPPHLCSQAIIRSSAHGIEQF